MYTVLLSYVSLILFLVMNAVWVGWAHNVRVWGCALDVVHAIASNVILAGPVRISMCNFISWQLVKLSLISGAISSCMVISLLKG